MRYAVRALATVVLGCFLFACAHEGPILVNMRYKPPAGLVSSVQKPIIGIAPFQDSRTAGKSVVGRKANASGEKENDLVVQGTVADTVTASFREAFQRRGFVVRDLPATQVTAAGAQAAGVDIVIGGEIKKLWVDVISRAVRDNYKVDLQIGASLHNRATGATRTLNLNCSLDREDIRFTTDLVEGMLNEALSTAVEQLLANEEFKKSPG